VESVSKANANAKKVLKAPIARLKFAPMTAPIMEYAVEVLFISALVIMVSQETTAVSEGVLMIVIIFNLEK